jgi:hypothetical protein
MPGVNFAEKLDCYHPAFRSEATTRTQPSPDKFLDDLIVENVYAAIRRKMPNRVVLGARARWDDGERTRHSSPVGVLQVPFVTTLVFGLV